MAQSNYRMLKITIGDYPDLPVLSTEGLRPYFPIGRWWDNHVRLQRLIGSFMYEDVYGPEIYDFMDMKMEHEIRTRIHPGGKTALYAVTTIIVPIRRDVADEFIEFSGIKDIEG